MLPDEGAGDMKGVIADGLQLGCGGSVGDRHSCVSSPAHLYNYSFFHLAQFDTECSDNALVC